MPANDGKISGLTRISGLDRTADLFEVDDVSVGASKSATVNDMLGITGAPMGTTDTQSPTNKTFDNSNQITIKGSKFTLQDATDTSKQAVFSMAGITTGSTRTYTLPNATGTLMDLASTQTATNKTLTSPTINTATINNPTLNTDAISEFTSTNGVTVDGVKMKDGALATNNSVVTANITDAAVTPAKLVAGTGSGWGFQTFTPSWTNLTVGNGTNQGYYTQIGKMVFGYIYFLFGSTSSVNSSGAYFATPVNASTRYLTTRHWIVGNAWLQAAAGNYPGQADVNGSGTNTITIYAPLGTPPSFNAAQITSSVPATWTTNNFITAFFNYEAA